LTAAPDPNILARMVTATGTTRNRTDSSRRRSVAGARAAKPAVQPEASLDGGGKRTSSISPVAWIPVENMDFGEWATAGRRLSAMGRCGQWGLGDWIRYGNAKFGERYAWAARVTGYDVQTLMNMVYVASRFDISRRRENLSWSHHETIAALDPVEQDRWLDRATEDRLSISDLRSELRSLRRTAAGAEDQNPARSTARHDVECPHCGGAVPMPSVRPRSTAARRRTTGERLKDGETAAAAPALQAGVGGAL